MFVVAVEATVASVVPFLGSSPHQVGGLSPFSRIWRKISVRVELTEVLVFLLPHPKEGRDGPLRPCASEEVGLELSRELIKRVDGGERQLVVPPSSDPVESRRESPAHYGVWRAIQSHLHPECGYVLHWVRATIMRFQRREAEVLRDGCILNFLDKGRATKGALATLVLHPDGLVDLQTDALGIDVGRLAALPKGAWSDSKGNRGRSPTGWVTGGCLLVTVLSLPRVGRLPRAVSLAAGQAMGCSCLRTKGVEAGVVVLPPRLVVSWEGHLPRGCQVLSILATSGPSSSAKMLLGDPSCPRNQHDVVWPARAGVDRLGPWGRYKAPSGLARTCRSASQRGPSDG
ncbi:hypothetical protein GW17_00042647 [Ensete ventricosum]|nr:hypothetical protein GW17_00042647 [Ensete ventricosum]